MVVSSTWMRRRCFVAASIPLRIADGTSLALPMPKPTTLAEGSPITTSAEKLRFLPPFTTLVTRLIATTCSLRFKAAGSMRFTEVTMKLKLQSCFARGIGQRLDASMILKAAAVEDHTLDAFFLGALGHQLADGFGGGHVAAFGLGTLGDARCRHQRIAFAIIDDLGVDMGLAAKHRQARP